MGFIDLLCSPSQACGACSVKASLSVEKVPFLSASVPWEQCCQAGWLVFVCCDLNERQEPSLISVPQPLPSLSIKWTTQLVSCLWPVSGHLA